MISVEKALQAVLSHSSTTSIVDMPLSASIGHLLAEDVVSTADSPPFDKALLDGYAVLMADLCGGKAELRVQEEVTAGMLPTMGLSSGFTTRVMTGAPLPSGTQAIVMVEESNLLEQDGQQWVRLSDKKIVPGRGVLKTGAAMRTGEVVLSRGVSIHPQQVGLLCELGRQQVRVHASPRVAILSTGNELVPIDQTPGPGQIRNSNGPMLAALVTEQHAIPLEHGVVKDDKKCLHDAIGQALEQADVVILSGGVSAGVLDLVPGVMSELKVKEVFHKVRLKPGKPLWFGTCKRDEKEKLVFGLPGNPVSAFVCYYLFVRPALARMLGHVATETPTIVGKLAIEYAHRGPRPTFFPSLLQDNAGQQLVSPLPWQGSADLRSLAQANSLVHFPPGDYTYPAGKSVKIILV